MSSNLLPAFDPELTQAQWILGGLRPEDLVSRALTALQLGFSGNALQQLAGLDSPTSADLGTLPERAFADLGLRPTDRSGAIDLLVSRGGFSRNPLFQSLITEFPSFSSRLREHLAHWGGEPAGDYNDIAEFVHFVADLQASGHTDEVHRVFEFMEKQIEAASQDVRDLIGWGFFETLQNVASHTADGSNVYRPLLGPISRQIWQEIEQVWEGKSNLAEVLRAEITRTKTKAF